MDVSRTFRVTVLPAFAVLLCSCFAAAQMRSSYDPAQPGRAAKPRHSFVDFTLGRINSRDLNYGNCLDEGHRLLLEETIESGYFWSNLVSLGLLGLLFFILIYQHRIHGRRELLAADALTQYEHSLKRVNAEVHALTVKNQKLINVLTTVREPALRSAPVPPAGPEQNAARPRPATRAVAAPVAETTATAVAPARAAGKPVPQRTSSATVAVIPADQMGLFPSDVDLIKKVNSLKQQRAREEEEVEKLQRRLVAGGRDLEVEQKRNRQLKGE